MALRDKGLAFKQDPVEIKRRLKKTGRYRRRVGRDHREVERSQSQESARENGLSAHKNRGMRSRCHFIPEQFSYSDVQRLLEVKLARS